MYNGRQLSGDGNPPGFIGGSTEDRQSEARPNAALIVS